ncbi:hypothetical protein LEN26_021415 [Aphanomyces euteiches]|nr:hypothetical protein LEN26_021415 [Aphanomyces euteiches]
MIKLLDMPSSMGRMAAPFVRQHRSLLKAWTMQSTRGFSNTSSLELANGVPLHYTQYGPQDAPSSVVLVHGAPGSHNDFKYLAPLLVNESLNVIAFDLPGNGRTSAAAAGGTYGLTERAMANAVVEALDGLQIQSSIILGHSFGGHTAMRIASTAPSARGLALLTSVGLRPHNALRRSPLQFLGQYLQQPSAMRSLIVLLNKWLYLYSFKFPKKTPTDDFTFALQRIGSTNFQDIQSVVAQVAAKNLPTFLALAEDDAFIEPAIIHELGQALPPGVRIEYPTGGHNIQKTRVKELAPALQEWIQQILH